MRKLTFIFLLLMTFLYPFAQDKNYWQMKDKGFNGMKLQEIQQRLDSFYKNNYKGLGSGWKQYQRWLLDAKNHLDENGRLVNQAFMNWQAIQWQNNYRVIESAAGGSWYPLSMFSSTIGHSGRVNTVAFHPVNTNIIFASTPGGGLWKTSDHGNTWICISQSIALLGVAAVTVHPTNQDIIYILTGDGNGFQMPSIGVLKTTDGGANWLETDLRFNAASAINGYDLKMDPSDPSILIAATSNGIYRTINSGLVWNQVLTSANIFDLEFCPGSTDTCYAAGISSTTTAAEIYRSVDTGATWTIVSSASYFPSKPDSVTRIELAVTPSNSNYVYALFGGNAAGFRGLFVSINRGSGFTLRSNSPNIFGYNADGSSLNSSANSVNWSLSLNVSPIDTNIVFAGCINVWKSSDGGYSWGTGAVAWWDAPTGGSQFVHADIHSIETLSSNEIWACSDGGIFKTLDGGATWSCPTTNLNSEQYYYTAGTTSNTGLFYGGTQDNGVIMYQSNNYNKLISGDGGRAVVDFNNPLNVYVSGNGASFPLLYKSTTGFVPSSSYSYITTWSSCNCRDTATDFIVKALAISPANPSVVYVVRRYAYKSNDGGNNWTRYTIGDSSVVYSNIAISPVNSAIMYISDGSTIRKSLDSGINWVTVNVPATVQGKITDIKADLLDSNKIWVSCAGYVDSIKVFEAEKNTSGSFSFIWTNRSAGVPNVPVLSLALQGGVLPGVYAGTDIGVYHYTGTNGWTPFMNGLPNIKVPDIYIDEVNGYITAGTFGMGLWQSEIYGGCVSFINHSATPVIPVYGAEYFEAADSILSYRYIDGGAGTSVTYNAGNYVRMGPGFEVKAGTTVHAYIEGCNIGSRSSIIGRKKKKQLLISSGRN